MNSLYLVSFVCMGVVVSASGWGELHDGSWKGEGLAESQDHGEYDDGHKAAWTPHSYAPIYKWAPAPLGHDGRVVDTPEVAHAKAEHLAALAKAKAEAPADKPWADEHWAPAHDAWAPEPKEWAPAPKEWAPAPKAWSHSWAPAHDSWSPKYSGPPAHIELTEDGKNLKDTPEVAHAKAAHLAAVAAASHKSYGHAYPHSSW